MAMTLGLAAGAYKSLYEELLNTDYLEVVEQRAELIETSVKGLAELYAGYWDAHLSGGTLAPDGALDGLGEHHGELASWLMAPLRAYERSTTFSAQVRAEALQLAEDAQTDDTTAFRIAVHGWVAGRIVGQIDNDGPIIPAPHPDDRHLRAAYVGLLEHVAQTLDLDAMYEVAGSAVVWRFGGLTEALSPQPDDRKDNLAACLSRLVGTFKSEIPPRLLSSFDGSRQEEIVSHRNALTHVAERDGFGFDHAVVQSTDETFVSRIVQAASYFVCATIGQQLEADDDLNRWLSTRERVEADLNWALDYV